MYKTLTTRVIGIAPLIMHNGQTADPLNKYAKAKKEIANKRKKTEADYMELMRIEFLAALYLGPDGPVIPSTMIESNITEGAKKSKNGKLAQAGVMVDRHAKLEYDGPRTWEELFDEERFRLTIPVKIGMQKVVTCRPIFKEWSATIEVRYLDDILNERDLLTAIRAGGTYAGYGTWRPRHGRFALESDLAKELPLAAE
jgi:hypothetical protein